MGQDVREWGRRFARPSLMDKSLKVFNVPPRQAQILSTINFTDLALTPASPA